MAHITLAQQGLAAVEKQGWDEAIPKLSAALKDSANPAWLIARSKALVGVGRFEEALDDADLAWHSAYERNKRPLLTEAHYRRAVAYFRLGQYANAECCCMYAMRLVKGSPAVESPDPNMQWVDEKGFLKATKAEASAEAAADKFNSAKKDPSKDGADLLKLQDDLQMNLDEVQVKEWRMASMLRMQALGLLDKLPADDPARKVTTGLKPAEKKLADIKPTKSETEEMEETRPAAPRVPNDTPLRLQDFQTNTTMSVSIFSKGVNKEKLQVEFLPFSVRLDSIIHPNGEEKAVQLDFSREIDTLASKYTVTPNKVELSLAKKTAGKWLSPTIKADDKGTAGGSGAKEPAETKETAPSSAAATTPAATIPSDIDTTAPAATAAAPTATAETTSKGPAYPTSARSGPKNWDKLGEDENSDDEKDVNFFFKKLFKNAAPEQQRAMMKSFTESNGTSLSTDWNDVKDRVVETVPPEGVEARKWE